MYFLLVIACAHSVVYTDGVDAGTDTAALEGGGDTGGTDSVGSEGEDSAPVDDTAPYDVCGDGRSAYREIQEAIDASPDGTRLDVCPGNYGSVRIEGRTIEIIGGGGSAITWINGAEQIGVLVADSALTLTGFSVSGTAAAPNQGAAITLDESTAELNDIRVSNMATNVADTAVIRSRSSDTTWTGLVASANTVYEAGPLFWVSDGGSWTMTHALLTQNNAGTLLVGADSDVMLNNNLFVANTGSALDLSPTGENFAWVYNNVIDNNGGWGARLSGPVDFENNIVTGQAGAGLVLGEGAIVAWCDLWQNGDTVAAEGTNLSEDPRYTNAAAGDYSLIEDGSPCIDAGNPQDGYDDVDGTRNDLGVRGGPDGSW